MKEKDNQILKQNVGVDLDKEKFEAAFYVIYAHMDTSVVATRKFENREQGVANFIAWLRKHSWEDMPVHVTMEATGVYYELLAYRLVEQQFPVHVMLPNKAKKFAQSLDMKSKTDKLDAKALGKMGVERKLREWKPASENLRELRFLTRERESLINEKTRASNVLHALNHSHEAPEKSIARYKSQIEFFEARIKEVEKDIHSLIQEDEGLGPKVQRIVTTPGLNINTVAVLIAETNGFAAINNIKQLISYAGYDPRIQESGQWKGHSKISKQGNSHIRRALYFPALSFKQHSSWHGKFYERLKARKEKGMVAAVALQRKLLIVAYVLWKNDDVFRPQCAESLTPIISGIG